MKKQTRTPYSSDQRSGPKNLPVVTRKLYLLFMFQLLATLLFAQESAFKKAQPKEPELSSFPSQNGSGSQLPNTNTAIVPNSANYTGIAKFKLPAASEAVKPIQSIKKTDSELAADMKPLRNALAQRLKSQPKVQLDLFVMSQCPFGVMSEQSIAPIIREFGKQVDLRLNFIAGKELVNGKTVLSSLHGQPEIDEDIRQLVIARDYPDKLIPYLEARASNYRQEEWQTAAAKAGIDAQVLTSETNRPESRRLLEKNLEHAQSLNINASPTLLVDGAKYEGDLVSLTALSTAACQSGTDPFTGSSYTLCAATPSYAWITGAGTFHADYICKQLGYAGIGRYGGTCGAQCGYCTSGTSCSNPQSNTTFDGSGNNGSDQYGIKLAYTVHWECVGAPTCTAPTFTTCPGNLTATTAANSCAAVVTYNSEVAGTTPTVSYSFAGATTGSGAGTGSGSSFNKGVTTVTLKATNSCGTANCTFTVTVSDTQKPLVTTNGNKSVSSDAGVCGAAVTVSASATDNCSVGAPTGVRSDGRTLTDIYPVGTTTITWNVSDAAGNAALPVTQSVTVSDNEKPTVVTRDIAVQLDGSGNASITAAQVDNGSSDACGIASLSLDKTSFTCANRGANTVTLTVTDNHGNRATGAATVTVEDKVAPTVVTKNISIQLDDNGTAAIAEDAVNNGSSDACGNLDFDTDVTSFNCSNVGNNTVTLTVHDGSGNSASATATVTVQDVTPPSVVAQDITVQLDAGGSVSITPAQVNNGSFDACGIASYSLSKTTFDCSNVGINQVTLIVTDIHNNVGTATATVTVEDKTAPVVMTKPVIVYLDAQGHGSIAEDAVNNGSSDACGGLTFDTDITSFDCSNVNSPVTVTLTVTDAHGNSAAGTALVTVVDNTAPTVRTRPITVPLVDGVATITPQMVDDGSWDACGIESMTLNSYSYNCSAIGDHMVTLTVTDRHGNSGTGTALVTIEGVIPSPSITVSRTNTTYTGPGTDKTIFLGYGAQSLNLAASDAAAPAATVFTWSPAAFLSTPTGATTTYTPDATQTGSNTINVLATNRYGCAASASVTLKVVDARCGADNTKVNMCHIAGNDATHVKTICIDAGSVQDHLKKGCSIGVCPESGTVTSGVEPEIIASGLALKAMPNPSTGYFTLKVESSNLTDKVMLRVMDVKGRLVEMKQDVQPNQTLRIGDHYRPGIYFIEVVQGAVRTQTKLIKMSN